MGRWSDFETEPCGTIVSLVCVGGGAVGRWGGACTCKGSYGLIWRVITPLYPLFRQVLQGCHTLFFPQGCHPARENEVVECGVWSVECGVWSVECGVWSVEYGVWSVECGVWSVEYGVWSMECGVWSMECGVWSVLWQRAWSRRASRAKPRHPPRSLAREPGLPEATPPTPAVQFWTRHRFRQEASARADSRLRMVLTLPEYELGRFSYGVGAP